MRSNTNNTQPKPQPAALRAVFAFFRFAARMAVRVFSMALCLVLAFFAARNYFPNLLKDVLGFQHAQDVSDTVIREELRAISELATYEFTYVNHVDFTNQPELLGHSVLLTDHWFAFDYHGTIKAGYDLEKVSLLWIDSVEHTIGIHLPEVAVFSNDIFVDMSTYQDRNNLCNPLQPREVLDYLYSRKQPELDKALNQGLLTLAGDNAKRLISLIVEAQGYSAVFIE